MKISIIGASVGVGLETVRRALERGYHITTLSRSPIPNISPPDIQMITGDATRKEELKKAIQEADAVIVALGTGKSMKATTLFTDFTTHIIQLHQESSIQVPIIVLTGFGAGDSVRYFPFYARWGFQLILGKVYDDKTKMEKMIETSGLKYIIVRPGFLNNNALTENYTTHKTLFKGIKIGKISRANVADYMVQQAEHPTDLYKCVSLTE